MDPQVEGGERGAAGRKLSDSVILTYLLTHSLTYLLTYLLTYKLREVSAGQPAASLATPLSEMSV